MFACVFVSATAVVARENRESRVRLAPPGLLRPPPLLTRSVSLDCEISAVVLCSWTGTPSALERGRYRSGWRCSRRQHSVCSTRAGKVEAVRCQGNGYKWAKGDRDATTRPKDRDGTLSVTREERRS